MKPYRRLEDADVNGKTVLVRVDFNVPVTDEGKVADDTRLRSALPTISYLRENGAKVVLLSHFGRPKGEPNPKYSLGFLAEPLSELVGHKVLFSPALVGPSTKAYISAMQPGDVLLVENTRFHPGEEKGPDGSQIGDPLYAKAISQLGDLFVHDAFSVAHRAHASSSEVAEFIPAYAGLALEREIDHLIQALENPNRPVMAIVGGAKVSTKIDLLKNLVEKLDVLAIGGGMANTFLAAQGFDVGASLCEHDLTGVAREIMSAASKNDCQILLPSDVVVASEFKAGAESRVCGLDEVKDGEMILDAGPTTVEKLVDAMDSAKTLIWNGPLGAFEMQPFDTATVEAAKYAATRVKEHDLIAVAGGGDTVSALKHAGVADDFTFVSTAGGAFLEWMEGKTLPGVLAVTQDI